MKKTLIFLIIVMMFSFSACGWKIEIVNPNDRVIESEAEIKPESEPEPEETDKNEYYDEVLEIPENPVKNEEDSSVSEDFEFSEPTKEISVVTAAHYEKTINLVLPESAVLEGEDYALKAVFSDGSELSAGWIFVHKLEETTLADDTLYYYRNPEKSLGYVSHEKAVCGKYECLRIICWSDFNKDSDYLALPDEEKTFIYEYFFEINDCEVLWLSFYAKGPENAEAMKLQEKIIANLSVKDPESYVKIENGKLYGMIHPMIDTEKGAEICKDELVSVSMSVPEGWEQGTLEEKGEIYGITFTMPWDERFETSFVIYKDNFGMTYDYFYNNFSWGLKINDHTFNEVSGNFSKGVYIRVDSPSKNIGDSENWFLSSQWFYVLQFDGYVVILHQNVRLNDDYTPFAEHEKACNDFAASIKIG
ncbi:MAG: hypothetical protein IKL18_07855 [Oscillospiraceae bacterium]|nr:hypothetical protein [Oscillospiraceae bacterium]